MTQQQSSRADSVWRHIGQMFGADSLERKFGATPPDDWRKMIDRLQEHELSRGLRRLAGSGRGHVPTLPEFLRMCREVGGDYADDAPKALPSPQSMRGEPKRFDLDERQYPSVTVNGFRYALHTLDSLPDGIRALVVAEAKRAGKIAA
jgi:hypothetical protein